MSADAIETQVNAKNNGYSVRWKKGDPFLHIPLDPTVPKTLKGTFQETLYIQQLQSAKPTYHRLQKNETTNKYEIINPDNQVVPYHKTAHIYSFVVLENEEGSLVLRLGLGNHYFTSGRTDTVKAAGDIHFWKGEITKITDQSGGYHTKNEDSLNSAYSAMAAVKVLPMAKFVAYNSKPETEKPVLLFSNPLKRMPHSLVPQPENTSVSPTPKQKSVI